MKKSFYFVGLWVWFTFQLTAQVDSKYLAGAVPLEKGKVVFRQHVQVEGESKAEMFRRALQWAQVNFADENNSVVYSSKEKAVFSCRGAEDLVFQSSTFVLDKTIFTYQLNVYAVSSGCNVELKAGSYIYNVSYSKTPEVYKAENWITDKEAVNKDKLYKHNGKFRIKTIDWVEKVFSSLSTSLQLGVAQKMREDSEEQVPKTLLTAATPAAIASAVPLSKAVGAVAPITTHKQLETSKIPGNIIKMLSNDWMLITGAKADEVNMMTASWGGLGVFLDKPVTYSFVHPNNYTYQLLDKGEYYTLSFYTEAYRDALLYCGSHSGKQVDKVKATGLTPLVLPSGAVAFEEAWLILECKKVLGQTIEPDAVFGNIDPKSAVTPVSTKLFAGEILGVWVK